MFNIWNCTLHIISNSLFNLNVQLEIKLKNFCDLVSEQYPYEVTTQNLRSFHEML